VEFLYSLGNIIFKFFYIVNKMGGACGTYWGEEQIHARFWVHNLKERDHWNALGLDVSLILK